VPISRCFWTFGTVLFLFFGYLSEFSECSTLASFLPFVLEMAEGLEGFLRNVMRSKTDEKLFEHYERCLKAYASRPCCAGDLPYKPSMVRAGRSEVW